MRYEILYSSENYVPDYTNYIGFHQVARNIYVVTHGNESGGYAILKTKLLSQNNMETMYSDPITDDIAKALYKKYLFNKQLIEL
jgi:hypothetical protein